MTYRYPSSRVRWLCWITAVSALAEFHQPAVFHSPVLGLYQRSSALTASLAQARYCSGSGGCSGCGGTATGSYGVGAGAPGWLSGWPALKCSSAGTKVASASQRVSELRGSRASVTQATAVYQGSDHGATRTQAKVSAQVAASTAGTSGDSRLYRYHASASSSSGHSTPISALIVAGLARWSPIFWNSHQNDGEMTRPDALGSGLSAFRP